MNNKGQSLIEILIAITFASFIFTAITALVIVSQRASRASRELTFAQTLIQDMISAVRGLSTQDWHSLWGSSGLVSYWALDEGVDDKAFEPVKGNTGTLTNGPMWQASANCKAGSCLSFDGVDDYVEASTTAALDLPQQFTIAGWVNPSNFATRGALIYKGHPTTNGWSVYGLWITLSSAPYFFISSGAAFQDVLSTTTLTLNQWQHLAAVQDATHRRIYLNGIEIVNEAGVLTPGVSSDPLWISKTDTDGLFSGLIDEVRIYNRALSPTEITNLYNGINKLYPIISAGVWDVREGGEEITSGVTTFVRSFTLGAVQRDSSGNIVTTGGNDDPATKKATYAVEIRGPGAAIPGRILSESEYVTRSGSGNTSVTLQTDWSGGSGDDGPAAFPTNKYSASSNVNAASAGKITMSSTSTSANLTSSIFDTGVAGGAQLHSLMWQGLPNGGVVKFQIASSNSASTSSSNWVYMGPTGTTDFYQPSFNVSQKITRLFHSNHRYFRYKVFFDPSANSPQVEDIAINWSP